MEFNNVIYIPPCKCIWTYNKTYITCTDRIWPSLSFTARQLASIYVYYITMIIIIILLSYIIYIYIMYKAEVVVCPAVQTTLPRRSRLNAPLPEFRIYDYNIIYIPKTTRSLLLA